MAEHRDLSTIADHLAECLGFDKDDVQAGAYILRALMEVQSKARAEAKKRRRLEPEDTFECHGKGVLIFQESDVPLPYKTEDGPPPRNPDTWAWGFTNEEDKEGEIDTIFLGFATKQAAMDDAWEYRESMLEDSE